MLRPARAIASMLALAVLAAPADAARVVLVGVDGASWGVIDPLLAAGELPALAALAGRGVTAELATVEPVISPVVWTSIATGVEPAAHGIRHFLSTRADLRVPTIFERLAAGGRRVGLYDYLVTWPPPALEGGFAIPGWLRRDDSVLPADVWKRAGLTPWVNSYDGLENNEAYLTNAQAEVREKTRRLLRLVERFDLEVAATTFYGVDALSHRFWRESFPGEFSAEEPAEARPVVQDIMRATDGAIGAIAAALEPDDVLLVVSDHGFQANPRGAVIWTTRLEKPLAHAKLDPERDGFTVMADFAGLVVRVHPGPFEAREATLERLRELVESARSPEGEPLFAVDLLDAVERPPGARRSIFARLRQWAVRWFLRLRFGVELDQPAHGFLVAQPQGDALEALWPDGRVEVGGAELAIRDLVLRDHFSGAHHPTAIFVAAGGPVRHVRVRGELSVLDVAPLVAYLAGAAIPDDLEGELPRAWIDADYLAAHPPRRAAPPPVALHTAPAGADAASDAELTERLRRLGYVE